MLSEGTEWLLQLNNVFDGFWYERKFELFFDSRVIGLIKFSYQVSDADNKGENSFE